MVMDIQVLNRILEATFGKSAPVAKVDGDQIVVDAFTISENEFGFALDVAVNVPGNRWCPPDCDIVDIATDRSFYHIAGLLAVEIAKMRVNNTLENMVYDQQDYNPQT